VNGNGAVEANRWDLFTEEERAVVMLGLTGAVMTALSLEGTEGAATAFETAARLTGEIGMSMGEGAPDPLLMELTARSLRLAEEEEEKPPEPTDPRELQGADAPEAGDQIDAQRAVLFDDLWATLMRGDDAGEVKAGLQIGGRINQTDERASVLYIIDPEQLGQLVVALLRVVRELGPEAHQKLIDQMGGL